MPPDASASPGKGPPADLAAVIQRAKQELEHMMDLTPQAMLLVNPSGAIVRTNRALLRLLQTVSFRDVLGRDLAALFPLHEGSFFGDLLQRGRGQAPKEADIVLPDGKTHTLKLSVVASGMESDLSVMFIEDVTGEKLQSRHAEKEHKREAIGELMGALKHNINQPLTVIMVKAGMLHIALEKGTADPAEMKRTMQEIMDLTMEIAMILDKVKIPKDYVTESYLEDIRILDIERSSQGSPPAAASGDDVSP